MRANSLITLATAGLLIPYLQLLASLWAGGGKNSAASELAFAAALLLAWLGRAALRPAPCSRPFVGVAVLAVAVLGYVAAVATDFRVGVSVFAVSILGSLVALGCGWRAVWVLRLPFLLLLLATPLPGFVLNWLSYVLLHLSATIAPPVLTPIVGAVQSEGLVLHFAAGSVALVDDCSGLGGLLLFLPVVLLLVYAYGPMPPLRALLLIALALPLAFAGNFCRVLVSALFVHWGSPLANSSAAHEVTGIVTLLAALGVLFVCCRLLSVRGASTTAEASA